ncbi:MAG TPA: ATP-binding protein [Kofleriaceae bacterium]|jgi:signal transduction histidine kinase/ActR/RegA family two-component response regulator|nr:ATP-binding protein [Kofleriaceae bacterium]
MIDGDETEMLREVAFENARVVLATRQRVEEELRRAKAALEEQSRDLELLNRTGAMLGAELDLEALVQAITDAGTQLSGAEFGAFFYAVQNPVGGMFTLYTLSGAPRGAFERLGHPRATPLLALTFEDKRVVRIGNVHEDSHYGRWSPHYGMPAGHLPVCSYLAVPVTLRSGEVAGGLLFGHSQPNMFTQRHERLLAGLAAQAGIAIDNARMYEDARRTASDREQLLEAERAARAEVERVSVMKDEFLATLSHELRTPLNAILGWSDMLLSHNLEGKFRRGLEIIARNARIQAQLIEDLLDMNRILSGKLRLDIQRLDLATTIEAVIDSLSPSANAKSLTLHKTLDPSVGPVFGDPQRLQQILGNLLSNSIKFTPHGGTIDVLLKRVTTHVEICVTDSGIGISPDFLPHVFERFRQADSSTTRKHGGLGLGLSIVKHLVELHGGSVVAESPRDRRGARFIVKLPIHAIRDKDEAHPPGRTSAIHELAFQLTGVRVLVVDDEHDARELISSVLASVGAVPSTAVSAVEALALLAEHSFDLIISDIGMPERDGYQLMRAVRAMPPERGGKTPAIAVTAFARSEDRTRALLAGYQVHLAKPIEPHELVVTAGSLTGKVVAPGA